MSKGYDVKNWYWIVAGNEMEVYSSAAAAYVGADDATYVEWCDQGGVATRIADEDDLKGVFAAQYPAGWPGEGLKVEALAALEKSDITVLRCVETGGVPTAWVTYRAALRDIISGRSQATSFPTRPPYP